ncbi:MAG: hypothetical protein JWQ38_684 [Flavipsychrobacter sp.]|nr:hypothetical protein [Flavipsychrobacter sp.]
MRKFLTEHVFYHSGINEPFLLFNKGFFSKLSSQSAMKLTQSELQTQKQKLKQPYSLGKQRSDYILIDGSKSINGVDFAYHIDVEVVTDLSNAVLTNVIPRYYLNLISEVSHKTVVSTFSH